MKKTEDDTPKKAMMFGLGLDNTDGHTRLTRGKNFTLCGGSQETHAVMQETAIKVNERLEKKGKSLEEVSPREFHDILVDVTERIGYKKKDKNE
ncbi:MAG: hypothetical protein IKW74_03875 [Thermoguttaceae bacterium]|nr:hypothetical protein [Thermoguttaceae bacterium]